MSAETKTALLIPTLDKTPKQARREYFGKYPPETNGDLPGYTPASEAVALDSVRQAERVSSTRRMEKRLLRRVVRIGAAVVAAALVAAGVAENYIGNGRTTQAEVVRPYDTPWDLVRRADHDAGINPDAVDMRPVVDRLVQRYGDNLQPGQKISVELDK